MCHLPPLEQSPSCTGAAKGTCKVEGGQKLLPAWHEDGMAWSRSPSLGSSGLGQRRGLDRGDWKSRGQESAAPNLWKQMNLCSHSPQGCHLQPYPMGALWAIPGL